MNHRHIYLVFSKTGTWLSRAINLFCETKYVHTSISFDKSFTKMYSFGRVDPDNPFSGGFVEENLYDGVYKKFPGCECLIYKVRITSEQYNRLLRSVTGFQQNRNKYGYNFLGLIGVLLDMPIKRKNRYFCSQFVSEVLIKSDIYSSEKSPELIRSNDLFAIKNKELYYEGRVNEYRTFEVLPVCS